MKKTDRAYYACDEHVDYILDDYIYAEGTFPQINKIEPNDLWITCAYCEKKSVYLVGNISSHTKCG